MQIIPLRPHLASNPLADIAVSRALKALEAIRQDPANQQDARTRGFFRQMLRRLERAWQQGDTDTLRDQLRAAAVSLREAEGNPRLAEEASQAGKVVGFALNTLRQVQTLEPLEASDEDHGTDYSLEELLEKHQAAFPDLTLEDLEAEAALGAPDEESEHGGDGYRVALQHLALHPYYYTQVLLPAEKAAGIHED